MGGSPSVLHYIYCRKETIHMYQTIHYEKQDNIAIVTIDRPEALNALNSTVITDLKQVVTTLENDRDIRCMILTGAGRSFVAGADIGEQCSLDLDGGRRWGQRGSALMRRIEKLEFPTIAAVNGFALGGGCELALSCDIILASEKAKFGQPEVGLGITPGFGGTQRMPRICGTAHAMELILTADTINAQQALEIGLVSKVVAPDALMDTALELANKIASKAQVAIRAAKQAVRYGMQCDISTAATYEALAFATCFGTEDQKDAMKAFVEKKKLDGFKNR